MTTEIERQPTENERKDFENISNREFTSREKFETELAKEFQKAMKKGLPFCAQAARDEFNDYYELETKKNIRKNGFLIKSEIKPLKIDWDRFSNLKNFDILDSGEVYDNNLSKRNPGLDVQESKTKYQFKGTIYTITVMEGGDKAILRAKKKAKELNNEITGKK